MELKRKVVFLLLFAGAVFGLHAQNITVSGTVTDGETGAPIPAVNVVQQGTSNGTSADFDGNYVITVPSDAVLVFSGIGFATQSVSVNGRSTLNVVMQVSAEGLDEVVVTAFGYERKTRSLGYAVTEVDGEDFVKSRAVNLGNALSGKVAGVVVTNPSTGPGGTSRVVIRGGSSLRGNDQPLYVVNGVPIDNTNQGAAGLWGGSDGGDGLSSLNPDDIENISVLKGNSAAALYGARAANGVILITTKGGSARKGVGVSFNSNLLMDMVIDRSDLQREYGYGTNGEKPVSQEAALNSGGSAWGARHDGSQVVQFDGVQRPYSDTGERLNDFYRTGYTLTNTLGLEGGNEIHTYRFSASNLTNEGVTPNSGFDKNQFTANISGNYGKLTAQVSGTYSREERKNSPRVSDTPGNPFFTAITKASAFPYSALRGSTPKFGAREDGTELQHQGNPFAQNPYWASYQWLRLDNQTRFFGNAALTYNFTDWLYVTARAGIDQTDVKYQQSEAYGTAFKPLGDFNIYDRDITEENYDLFVGFNRTFGDFGVDVLLGGNILRQTYKEIRIGGNNLSIPFFASVNNVENQTYSYGFRENGTNSIFGQANFSYKEMFYLNFTGRQDTFSTLAADSNTLFYPSVGASVVLSEAVELPEIFTYARLRGTWAQVGGGAPNPYDLNLTYALEGQGHNGATLGRINNGSIPNALLQPYTSTEFEVGADLRFLNDRLGLDFAVYNRKTTNDILATSISNTSGFGSTLINVGEVQNKGFEMLLSGTPIRTQDFEWTASLNMSNNENEVVNLGSDAEGNPIEFINLDAARTLQENTRLQLGQPAGVIAGFRHKEINGQKVYTAEGFPVRSDQQEVLALGRYPFTAGFSSSFRYKNFNAGFLIDFRSGASVMSGTNVLLYRAGLHKNTLVGREGGITVSGVDNDGAPVNVTIPTDQVDDYYRQYAAITENFVYDAKFAKLRELSLGYSFPQTFIDKTFLQALDISIVGRNLWLLYSDVPNVDPESGYTSSAGSQGLEFFAAPTSASFGLNIAARF